jgi:hypothetical protein
MALIENIKHVALQSQAAHTKAECTFDVIDLDGAKYLQLDTYGSKARMIPGKKSQSIRLAPSAISALKQIIDKYRL